MSMTVGELVGYIDLDDKQFDSKLDGAHSKFAGLAGKLGKLAVGAAAAAGAGIVAIAKVGLDEMMEASAVTAQLEAGIKSTGNAANVTVDGMNALASSIQAMSGQTDDSIAQTQALLMTFTNIRNVGVDKIFDQATLAAANMAAKMGGDATANAMQLGKALNDPVKGVAALTRVGVQFTDAQKDSIAAMVEAGDVMGAQKVILGELETQFGGAAEAAGQSLPGQLERLKRSFEDLAQGAMEQFMPSIQKALGWLLEKMPAIQSGVSTAFSAIGRVFSTIGDLIAPFIDKIRESGIGLSELTPVFNMLNPVMGVFKEFWPALQPVLSMVMDLLINLAQQVLPIFAEAWQMVVEIAGPIIRSLLDVVIEVFPTILSTIQGVMDVILPLITDVLTYIKEFWDEHGAAIMAIVEKVFGFIQQIIEKVMPIIQAVIETVVAIIRGDWDAAWNGIKDIFAGVWELIKTIVTGALDVIKSVISGAWDIIKSLTSDVWNGIKSTLGDIWDGMKDAFQGMWDAMSGAWDTAAEWIKSIPGKIKDFFLGAADWLVETGKSIIRGLWDGLKAIWESLKNWFLDKISWLNAILPEKWEIHSPSRVFFRYGSSLMEGLRLGLVEGADGVADELSRIGSFATGDMSVSVGARVGGAHGGGAQVVHHHNTFQVNASSGFAMAREAAAALQGMMS